jgi:hypothetical protein
MQTYLIRLLLLSLCSSPALAQAVPSASEIIAVCKEGAWQGIVNSSTPSTIKKDPVLRVLPGDPVPFEYGFKVKFSLEGEDKFGDRLVFPFVCEAYKHSPRYNPIYRRSGAPVYAPGYPKQQANSEKWGASANLQTFQREDEERPRAKTVPGQAVKPSDEIAASQDMRRPEIKAWAAKLDAIEARLLTPAKNACANRARDELAMQVDKVLGKKIAQDENLFLINVYGKINGKSVVAGCAVTNWDKTRDQELPQGTLKTLHMRPHLPHDEDRGFK